MQLWQGIYSMMEKPLVCASVILACFASLAVYRLVFHPLAGIPGPKIAALSGWYEFYWDCPKKGRFWTKIREMHEQYGPIIRINPWEVHINDPSFFESFYTNSKLDKHEWFYHFFTNNDATVATVTWERHKARRGTMARYFSSANVAKLEPKVQARVRQLLDRIEIFRSTGEVINFSDAYRCYATDVVTDYAAPQARDNLSTPDFAAAYNRALRDLGQIFIWHRHFPILVPIMNTIPKAAVKKMDPATGAILDTRDYLLQQARTVIETKGVPQEKQAPTVLDAVYTSPLIGDEDKTMDRLLAEVQTVINAGTETTGNTLAVFTYHVLAQPEINKRLKAELHDAAIKTPSSELMNYRTLERLPYLQACIKEALRLACGVTSRLPRVDRHSPITYTTPSGKTYTFAPNTVISMSILDLHYNSEIFSDPKSFSPDRWIESSEEKLQSMERAFAPFSRGPRQCIGLELAKEEITLMAGNLFHAFDFEIFETTVEDVSLVHDYFAPWSADDSKGMRAVVK